MLTLEIKSKEYFDESTNEFIVSKPYSICLEHSLVSISKWESKWQKAYLKEKKYSDSEQEYKESIDYIKCMTITQNVPEEVYSRLTNTEFDIINKYIDNRMSATYLPETKGKKGHDVVTSELIYYWMFSYQIPIDCQKWHINRLLMLIQVFNVKNASGKNKMSAKDVHRKHAQTNHARRARHKSRG